MVILETTLELGILVKHFADSLGEFFGIGCMKSFFFLCLFLVHVVHCFDFIVLLSGMDGICSRLDIHGLAHRLDFIFAGLGMGINRALLFLLDSCIDEFCIL